MSKNVIPYCSKFDLLYAVTVKAIGIEDEMAMRKNVGEIVDRLEPVINAVEKPGRVVVYVCAGHEVSRASRHTRFFKQSGAAVTHGNVMAVIWTLPSQQEYDEFEAHCDFADDMVVTWDQRAHVNLEIRFGNSMRPVGKDIFLKPFPTSRDAAAMDQAVNKWFIDSLKIDKDFLNRTFTKGTRESLSNSDLFGTMNKKYPNKFVYTRRSATSPGTPLSPDVDSTPAMEYDGYYYVAQRNGKRAKCKRTGEVFLTHKPSVAPGVNYIFPLERRTPDWYETVSNDIFETKYEEL